MDKTTSRRLYKVVVVGEKGSGKTALVQRYTSGVFHPRYKETVGVEIHVKKMIDEKTGEEIHIQFWDLGGLERNGTMLGTYYEGAHGFIFVYDNSNIESSYRGMIEWMKTVLAYTQKTVMTQVRAITVLTKTDLKASVDVNDFMRQSLNPKYITCGGGPMSSSHGNVDNVMSALLFRMNNTGMQESYHKGPVGSNLFPTISNWANCGPTGPTCETFSGSTVLLDYLKLYREEIETRAVSAIEVDHQGSTGITNITNFGINGPNGITNTTNFGINGPNGILGQHEISAKRGEGESTAVDSLLSWMNQSGAFSTEAVARTFTICVVGDCGVGKTDIIRRYCYDKWDKHQRPTIGMNRSSHHITRDGKIIELVFVDVAGPEIHGNFTKHFYQGVNAFVIVCDFTNEQSINSVMKWRADFEKHVPGDSDNIAVLINKTDEKCGYKCVQALHSLTEVLDDSCITPVYVSAKDDNRGSEIRGEIDRLISWGTLSRG